MSNALNPTFKCQKRGIPARDALHLHYPFDFVGFAPYKAFRRRSVILQEHPNLGAYEFRHWCVVFAGTLMIAVFWLLTPLSSAILNTTAIIHSSSGIATIPCTLIPMAQQPDALTGGFMMTVDGSLWLDQYLPGYTTKYNALMPFVVNASDPILLSNITWTSATTMYSTTLSCKPAIVFNTPSGTSYSNGKGSIASAVFDISFAWYIGHYSNDDTITVARPKNSRIPS